MKGSFLRRNREGIIQQKKLDLIVNEAVELNSESLKASKMGIKAVIECFTKPDLKP